MTFYETKHRSLIDLDNISAVIKYGEKDSFGNGLDTWKIYSKGGETLVEIDIEDFFAIKELMKQNGLLAVKQ